MNLDLFNNLINSTKENKGVQNFIKELDEFLGNNIDKNERNQESLIEKILDGRSLSTKYRDKINIQRVDIVTKYSKENSEQGEFYYVYSRGSDNTYGIVMHKDAESGTDIWIKESQLPQGAGIDSVLRVKNGKYVLDKEATKEIQEKITEMINKLLEEQNNELNTQRVDGHLYEFVEQGIDKVWLIDMTDYTGDCIEEFNFPKEELENAKEGDVFQYINGEYKKMQ